MGDITESLRSEIVDSQRARIDLRKWKLILVASIGGVALGIGPDHDKALPMVLGLAPLVCAYVDVLSIHKDLRILVIAAFLRSRSGTGAAYETFCKAQPRAFLLESLALWIRARESFDTRGVLDCCGYPRRVAAFA